MAPSDSRSPSIITRPFPDAVEYNLMQPDHVLINFPAGSTCSSGLHWHEQHVEYLRVVKGSIRVRLGATERIVFASASGSSEEIQIEKNVRHEWSRASTNGEDVVVMERTEPQDGDKAVLFWNLHGVLLDAQAATRAQGTPQLFFRLRTTFRLHVGLFSVFRTLDNFPVFVDLAGSKVGRCLVMLHSELPLLVEWLTAHFVLYAAAVALALVWGVEPVQRKYTPVDAFNDWQRRAVGKRKRG